jgi:hypothetical protein
MHPDSEDDRPLGVLLITTFWILLSIPCFYIASFQTPTSILGQMLITVGIVLILVAWGIFIYNKVAYVLSTILAGICMFPNVFTLSGLYYSLAYGYHTFFIFFLFPIFLLFIPLFIYHLTIISLYFPKQS